jgi:hypothetical protein
MISFDLLPHLVSLSFSHSSTHIFTDLSPGRVLSLTMIVFFPTDLSNTVFLTVFLTFFSHER